MTNTNPQNNSLESKLVSGYQDHIVGLINDYSNSHGYSVKKTAESLGYAKSTIGDWRVKKAIVPWEPYFGFMLKLSGETVGYEGRVRQLKKGAGDLLAQSINVYCSQQHIHVRDLAEKVGFSEGALYSWENQRTLARPQDMFRVFGFIYEGRATPEVLLEPIRNWRKLLKREYQNLIGLLELPALLESKELKDLIRRINGFSSGSPKEYAELMKSLLMKIGECVEYFKSSEASERDILRAACQENLQLLGMIATESRQILRKEPNYQEWLKMNRG